MENNRPIEAYIKATCEFLMQNIPSLKSRTNIDKLKWEFRDKLVTNEKEILCLFGFDLNISNPKELIEEVFSGYYRFNRDHNLPENFKKAFPKILQESRNFMVQAVTQPVSLLCDGYTFIVLSLIYCGLEYKKLVDKDFRYPKTSSRIDSLSK
ncbi:CPS_collapsed_G0039160.mRNA.1.CDS.1 [Saccharomyces cerevisiae]|nr:CPS_collapsed_G0039160.mRNA.1.CDS.1 [Saccharomyces cerevisiae]